MGPRDRVKPLPKGQRGEVYEVSGDRVAVLLDAKQMTGTEVDREEKDAEQRAHPPVYCHTIPKNKNFVLHAKQPLVVSFLDSSQWIFRIESGSKEKEKFASVKDSFLLDLYLLLNANLCNFLLIQQFGDSENLTKALFKQPLSLNLQHH
ncbi:hypothetical protein DVH24_042621 [Malus domestica]|uniref:Uncharacterized protein n=1 Tax=Malus domestica TaxID=3750 RepID=A0A498I0I4_MALDO|nr:hypothetical protein DVH24_042621 [Malus domestica]